MKHFREVSSRMKAGYLRRFVKHYPRMSQLLTYVRIIRDVDYLADLVRQMKPSLVLVDNKLAKYVNNLGVYLVSEDNIKYMYHRRLMLIADNLANYFRILLKTDPRNFEEEVRRFEK